MTTEWVDFKKVKEAVIVQMVLDHYGIRNLTRKQDELRGSCPIHNGSPKSKNFTVNIRKNAFQCFSKDCGARGNVLDFVAAMEHCSVRDAALKLHQWFKIGESDTTSAQTREATNKVLDVTRGIYTDAAGALFEVITSALSGEDFEPLVVYRELSGDYRYWVAPVENFGPADCHFNLVKAL